jgi:hypothetical protein
MGSPEMIQVDASHFSNVIGAVQRTASLTGGAVQGLPNGLVIGGLTGINSFSSGISEAQKEFQRGRIPTSLERIRQIETQFNGIAGRWSSTVLSLIASAKQGRQQISLQKLNEVKNAQTRMQQLAGPASKAFRDLVTALEHAVARQVHEAVDAPRDTAAKEPTEQTDVTSDAEQTSDAAGSTVASEDQTPRASAFGKFAADYRCGAKLQVQRGTDNKARIVPKLETDTCYFVAGLDPPRVIQVKALQKKAILVFDTLQSTEMTIEARELSGLIKQGVWILVKKSENHIESRD